MRTKTVPHQLEQQGVEEEKPGFRAGNVAQRKNCSDRAAIESEIFRGTVGAFAQSANFDKFGAEKCEGGHLN